MFVWQNERWSRGNLRYVRITHNVDLPDELIQAHQDGKIVLFVGAGASMSAPANLPNFKSLVEELGTLAKFEPLSPDEPMDQYLGRLEAANFDVKRHTFELLNSRESEPNSLHRAIVRLAQSSGSPKVITTNFDSLLEAAWSELGDSFHRWTAPALPLGDKFEGIIKLHGSLDGPVEDLIITDSGFGAAYVTRGWATRFLVDVFAEYVVLFVGYSHGDPIMRYVSNALVGSPKRFAMVGDTAGGTSDTATLFRSLGIIPVFYSSRDHHAELVNVLDEWARLSEMNLLERRSKVSDYLAYANALTPVEDGYLRKLLTSQEGIQEFALVSRRLGADRQLAVKKWFESSYLFSALFNRHLELPNGFDLRDIESWLAGLYTSTELAVTDLWTDLAKESLDLRESFFDALLTSALQAVADGNDKASSLVVFLRTSVPGITAPTTTHASLSSLDPRGSVRAIELTTLLRCTIKPLRPLPFLDGNLPYRLNWVDAGYALVEMLRPGGESITSPETNAVLNAIERAHWLVAAFNRDEGYDTLGASTLDLNDLRDSDHPLEVAIDYLVRVSASETFGEAERRRWFSSGITVLQRLAVNSLRFFEEWEADNVVRLLTSSDQFFSNEALRGEVSDVLVHFLKNGPENLRPLVFQAVTTSVIEEDRGKWLSVITEGIGGWPEAEAFIAEQHSRERVPKTATDGGRAFAKTGNSPLDAFLTKVNLHGFSYDESVVREIAKMTERDPADAIELFRGCVTTDLEIADSVGVRVLHALDEDTFTSWLPTLVSIVLSSERQTILHAFASRLGEFADKLRGEGLSAGERAATYILARFEANSQIVPSLDDWNSPRTHPELLIELLTKLVFARWADDGSESQILSGEQKALFQRVWDLRQRHNGVARGLARFYRFFLHVYEDFTASQLQTVFSDKALGIFAWAGYLSSPIYTYSEPGKSLLMKSMSDGWGIVAGDPLLAKRFMLYVLQTVSAGVYSTDCAVEILTTGVVELDDEQNARFIQLLGRSLARPNGKDLWERGGEEFIRLRAAGLPRNLSDCELRAICELPSLAHPFAEELVLMLGDIPNFSKFPISKVPMVFLDENLSENSSEALASFYLQKLNDGSIPAHLIRSFLHVLEEANIRGPKLEKLQRELCRML